MILKTYICSLFKCITNKTRWYYFAFTKNAFQKQTSTTIKALSSLSLFVLGEPRPAIVSVMQTKPADVLPK